MNILEKIKNFFNKRKKLPSPNATKTTEYGESILNGLLSGVRTFRIKTPELLIQDDIDAFKLYKMDNIILDGTYFGENVSTGNLDFSSVETKGMCIRACETSNIIFPKDVELIDIYFSQGIDFNANGKLNIPKDTTLQAININIIIDDLTEDAVEALKKLNGNFRVLITVFKDNMDFYFSVPKIKYKFLLEELINGDKSIASIREELTRQSEDPEYAFKSDPRYKQFVDCSEGKKIEDISESLREYIIYCYPSCSKEDLYWSKLDQTIITEESIDYRKKFFKDCKNTDRVLVIPGNIANEFCNHPKLKSLLELSNKIQIDLRYNLGECKTEFDLKSFIENKVRKDYELSILIDDLSLINDDLLKFLEGKIGIKVLLKKPESEPLPMITFKDNSNLQNMVNYIDIYDYNDLNKLKNIFNGLIMQIPNGLSTEEKVNFLYDQLKSIVRIKKMDEDPNMTEFYNSVNGLMNTVVNDEIFKTDGKKAPKIEYKSILQTLETGEGNPKDFLDTFYVLLKYSKIQCKVSDKAYFISNDRTYTKEFATLDNALFSIPVRSIDITLDNGSVMKIDRFIEDLELSEVLKVKESEEEQL